MAVIVKAELIPVPAPPTAQATAAIQIVNSGNAMYQILVAKFNASYNLIWNNSNATPQQVYDALEASNPGQGVPAKVVSTAASLRAVINGAVPNTLPAPLKTLTTNPDGTVTVGP